MNSKTSSRVSTISEPFPSEDIDGNVQNGGDGENLIRTNDAADFFYPIVMLLKFSGNCPLSYIRKHPTYRTAIKRELHQEYDFDFRSPFTWFCATMGLASISLWVIQISGLVIEQNILGTNLFTNRRSLSDYMGIKSGETSTASKTAFLTLRLVFYVIPLTQLLETLFAWSESKSFGKFLNNFREVQRDYVETFPNQTIPRGNLRRIRNIFIGVYAVLPAAVAIPMFQGVNALENMTVLGTAASILWAYHITFVSLLEDVKCVLSYFLLAESFRQIKASIMYSAKWEKLTAEKVKSWRRVVHGVRMQAHFAGMWQKNHQLMLLVASIVLITATSFASLNGSASSGVYNFFTFINGSFIFLIAGRIYTKIYSANLVTVEELMIARELVFLNIPEDEFAIQLEVKFLHDMIKQKPSVINFGSYVTLNKKLILGIASQVVTYLIVLMQFSQS